MPSPAAALADQFAQVNQAVIDVISRDDGDLAAICPGEGWPAVAVGAHICGAYVGIVENFIKPIVTAQELPPFSFDALHERNARQAAANAALPREEVVTLLRERGNAAAAYVRGLSDADLARTTTLPLTGDDPVTVAQVIAWVLIGHTQGHLESLRQGLG